MSTRPSTEAAAADAAGDAELGRLRLQISSVDRAILELVIQRIALAREIWEHKLSRGLALVDPEREDKLLTELQAANESRLSTAGLAALHAKLLTLTKWELERLLDPL